MGSWPDSRHFRCRAVRARRFHSRGPSSYRLGTAILHQRGLPSDATWLHLLPGMLIAGLACGVAPPHWGLAVDIAGRQLGMASGVNSMVLEIGSAVGIAAYGAALSRHPFIGWAGRHPHDRCGDRVRRNRTDAPP